VPTIADNIAIVRTKIAEAAARGGRSADDITLIAVSKTVAPDRIREALAAGVSDLGESYVQEVREKLPLFGPEVTWHFIGHLQSNKVKYVVGPFALIHSVDSLDLAAEIGRRAQRLEVTQDILLEVKLDPSGAKFGLAPEELPRTAEQAAVLDGVRLRGLMGMAPYGMQPEAARPYFARLRGLFEQLPPDLRHTLSMGMSGDYEVAVEEGATHVRLGSRLFGARS